MLCIKHSVISIDSILNLFLNFKMSFEQEVENEVIIPMIDARRDEVYTAAFLAKEPFYLTQKLW